jgi:plasmid stability protein
MAWLTARDFVDRGFACDCRVRTANRGRDMTAKGRLIMAALMSSMMVFMVTLLVTYLDLGVRSDFLLKWAKAYFIAWPVAATTAFLVMPFAQRATSRILAMLEGGA